MKVRLRGRHSVSLRVRTRTCTQRFRSLRDDHGHDRFCSRICSATVATFTAGASCRPARPSACTAWPFARWLGRARHSSTRRPRRSDHDLSRAVDLARRLATLLLDLARALTPRTHARAGRGASPSIWDDPRPLADQPQYALNAWPPRARRRPKNAAPGRGEDTRYADEILGRLGRSGVSRGMQAFTSPACTPTSPSNP